MAHAGRRTTRRGRGSSGSGTSSTLTPSAARRVHKLAGRGQPSGGWRVASCASLCSLAAGTDATAGAGAAPTEPRSRASRPGGPRRAGGEEGRAEGGLGLARAWLGLGPPQAALARRAGQPQASPQRPRGIARGRAPHRQGATSPRHAGPPPRPPRWQ